MKRRSLATFIVLGLIVFGGLAFYGDLPELLGEVSSFSPVYWAMVLGLALLNYLVRLVRWHYYLRLLGIRIGIGESTAIFMSGLSMAVSPGRVGELAKSYFLREKRDVPVALSSTAVIMERVTDLISVLLLSLWGLLLIPYGWLVALVVLVGFALFTFLVVSPWGSDKLLRLPIPDRWRPFLNTSRGAFRQVFAVKPLLIAVALGMLAWFAEGAGLWVVLQGMDAPGSLGQAVSIYAAATLLGAITMLPGGLVGTEGGMVALLQQVDLSKTLASSATFIIRVCTLWFAVAIGILALIYVQACIPRRSQGEAPPLGVHPETPANDS